MKKDLPKVFRTPISKPIQNNSTFFYGKGDRSEEVSPLDTFKTNQVYRTKVKITLKDKVVEKTIIGRTENNLITLDNEIIAITDIVKLELL